MKYTELKGGEFPHLITVDISNAAVGAVTHSIEMSVIPQMYELRNAVGEKYKRYCNIGFDRNGIAMSLANERYSGWLETNAPNDWEITVLMPLDAPMPAVHRQPYPVEIAFRTKDQAMLFKLTYDNN